MLNLQCSKINDPVLSKPSLPAPPPPNSIVSKRGTTNIKSFSLSKDLYSTYDSIFLHSQFSGEISHLWIFGDRMISKEANVRVNFKEPGIISVKHIVTINDTLKNEYVDTLFIGDLYLKNYIVDSISYPDVQIMLISSGSFSGSAYTGRGYSLGIFPFNLGAYGSRIYTNTDPVSFQMIDKKAGVVETNSVNINTIHKIMTFYNSGKFLCISQNGNIIWAEFEMR